MTGPTHEAHITNLSQCYSVCLILVCGSRKRNADLLHKDAKWNWGKSQEYAFKKVKVKSSKVLVPNMASACIQRWALLLGAYNHSLIYKPGKAHNNADSLSRMPGPFEHATVPKPAEVVFSLEHFESGPVNSQNITLETRKDPI